MRKAGLVGVLAALIFTVGMNGAAAATAQSWSQPIATASQTTSKASATWSQADQTLHLTLTTGALAAGKCVTVFFDWKSSAHYDARALRDCKSHDTFSMSYTEARPNNIVGGPNKLGVCYGPDDSKGTCLFKAGAVGTVPMDWTPWPDPSHGNPCDETWKKRAVSGTVTQFVDPHPMQSTMVSGKC
jgi:hypothetical protein